MDDDRVVHGDSTRSLLAGTLLETGETTMTDDGFVFGDNADGNDADEHETSDESELFGTRTDESPDTADDRRFGTPTTDDAGSSRLERVRTAARGESTRTATTVALAAVLVITSGLVAYPLVMGALDTANSPERTEATTEAGSGLVGSPPSQTARTTGTTVEPVGPTAVTTAETTVLSTTTAPTARPSNPTPTATPTPTPLPTRGFPAGNLADENETNESA